eukprot:5473053-Pyramimonas_sp.AAC.1
MRPRPSAGTSRDPLTSLEVQETSRDLPGMMIIMMVMMMRRGWNGEDDGIGEMEEDEDQKREITFIRRIASVRS